LRIKPVEEPEEPETRQSSKKIEEGRGIKGEPSGSQNLHYIRAKCKTSRSRGKVKNKKGKKEQEGKD